MTSSSQSTYCAEPESATDRPMKDAGGRRVSVAPRHTSELGQVPQSAPFENPQVESGLGHFLTVEALAKEGIQIIEIGLYVHVASPVPGDVERWAKYIVASAEEVR